MIKYILICLLIANNTFAISGNEILKKVDNAGNYKTAFMNATMSIIPRSGTATTMKLEMYEKKDGDMSLMKFTYPARLKGTAILSKGDNIWYYNKRTNRIRLLSKSAKKGSMMGSSFSYEDMSSNYAKNYSSKIIKETSKEYILELIPNDKDKTYKKLIMTVLKENNIPINVKYFDENEINYKELKNSHIETIGKRIIPTETEMKDLQTLKVTKFILDKDSLKYNINIKDNTFSERKLKR